MESIFIRDRDDDRQLGGRTNPVSYTLSIYDV